MPGALASIGSPFRWFCFTELSEIANASELSGCMLCYTSSSIPSALCTNARQVCQLCLMWVFDSATGVTHSALRGQSCPNAMYHVYTQPTHITTNIIANCSKSDALRDMKCVLDCMLTKAADLNQAVCVSAQLLNKLICACFHQSCAMPICRLRRDKTSFVCCARHVMRSDKET